MKLTLRRTEFDEEARADFHSAVLRVFPACDVNAEMEKCAGAARDGKLLTLAVETYGGDRAGTLLCVVYPPSRGEQNGNTLFVTMATTRSVVPFPKLYRGIHGALARVMLKYGGRRVRALAWRRSVVRLLEKEGFRVESVSGMCSVLCKEYEPKDLLV